MLFIFRHYQKSLYTVVGILLFLSFIITTFLRLGEAPLAVNENAREVGKLFDGTPVTDIQLRAMMALIDADEGQGEGHPLIRGVITQFLMADGLFSKVFDLHHKSLESSLDGCKKKVSRSKAYSDPNFAELNVESIYKRLTPQVVDVVEKMKQPEISSKEFFDLALEYMQLKEGVSQDLIRQFFSYMAASKGVRVHPPQNTALIQIQRLSDLFSKQFMELVAFTLLNGSKYAHSMGVGMTLDEVKAEVVAKVVNAMRQQGDSSLPFHRISIRNIAGGFGLNEERFLEAYQSLSLFKRFMEIEKTQNLLDPLMAQKVASFATKKAEIELFKMPEAVKLKSFEELFKFQCYLEATTGALQDRRNLGLNLEPVAIEELEKNAPELLKTEYILNVKKLSLSDVSLSIPLKKMLKWQLEDENFYAIADEFRQVQDLGAIDDASRKAALDKLDGRLRQAVDAFSRRQMYLQDKKLLSEAFSKISEERMVVDFLLSGKTDAFIGAEQTSEVLERFSTLEDKESFSFDNEHFYQVTVLEKGETPQVLTYEEARDNGQLDLVLDRYLKTRYPQVRIMYRDQFESKDGDWLPYELVKSNLEKLVFKDLLQAIETSSGYKGFTLEAPQQFYLDNRFRSHLETFVATFDASSMEELKVKLSGLSSSATKFSQQFIPEIKTVTVDRSTAGVDLKKVLNQAVPKALIGPQLYDKGEQVFLSVQGWLDADKGAISLVQLQNLIGKSAKKEAMDLFFTKIGAAHLDASLDPTVLEKPEEKVEE
ncbi:MAG: hypothetical protein ACOYK9_01560 [Chlamydiia bacterium]